MELQRNPEVRSAGSGESEVERAGDYMRNRQVYAEQRRKRQSGERAGPSGHRELRVVLFLALLLPLAGACGTDPAGETARIRGDRAFARGDYDEALAEYRLSLLREDPGTAGAVRAAHAYVALGRVDEARALYDEAVAQDSVHADQAVSDLVALARRAHQSRDNYGMASAMEAALHFRPGLAVEELALPMARHYSNSGEYGRARPLYLRALGENRADPDIILETALAHEEIGDCESALIFLEEFRELAPRREDEVRWHVGSCSFQMALEVAEEGSVDEALQHLDAVLELQEPRTLLAQAYFEKGEILVKLGDCAAALNAYRAVTDADASGSGSLVRRALDRVDEIRFSDGEGTPC